LRDEPGSEVSKRPDPISIPEKFRATFLRRKCIVSVVAIAGEVWRNGQCPGGDALEGKSWWI
jgi:hypothetical protein